MKFSECVWRGFGPFVLLLSLLDHGVVRASAQVATSNPSLRSPASKAEQSETMPLAFSQKAFPDAFVGLPFHSSVAAIGGSGLFGLTVTGDLPPGLNVETGANTIAIEGVPTEAGHYRLQIDVRDADGTALKGDFTIQVSRRLRPLLLLERFITDNETFNFNDAENVFFPVVITDAENFSFADSHGEMDAKQIGDSENFTFGDLPSIDLLTAQAINFPALLPLKYGVSPITLTATGGASGDPVVFSVLSGPGSVSGVNGTTLTITGVGTVVVAANQAGNTVYAPAPQVTRSVVVNLGPQTISFPAPASPVNYGVSPITLAATGGDSGNPVVFSIVSGPGSVSGTNGTTLTITGVGTVVVAANQAGNADYAAATQATQSVVVNAAPQTISFPAPASPVTFPVSPITLAATGGASGSPVVFSVVSGPGTVSGTNGTTLTITNSGTVVVAANQAGSANYASATQVTRSIVVNPPTIATLLSPMPGSTLAGSSVTFSWNPGLSTEAGLSIGTTYAGSQNIYYSGIITATSVNVTGLPTFAGTLYVRLSSKVNGTWQYNDYTYTEGGSLTPAFMSSPTPGSVFAGSSQTFSWNPASSTEAGLSIGTTGVGSQNIYYSGIVTASSANVTGLPTSGQTVYVRLSSKVNGTWEINDYVYTAP
jgi:hypothetical protein